MSPSKRIADRVNEFATKKDVSLEDQIDLAEEALAYGLLDRHVEIMTKLAKRTKEDDSAFVKELLKMKNRLDQFERDLKKLKAVHA